MAGTFSAGRAPAPAHPARLSPPKPHSPCPSAWSWGREHRHGHLSPQPFSMRKGKALASRDGKPYKPLCRAYSCHAAPAMGGHSSGGAERQQSPSALEPKEARAPLSLFALPQRAPQHSPPSLCPSSFSRTHIQLPPAIFVSKEKLIRSISSAPSPDVPPLTGNMTLRCQAQMQALHPDKRVLRKHF